MTAVQRPDSLASALDALDRRVRALESSPSHATALIIPNVAADPSPLAAGMVWMRSDTHKLCWTDNGSTVYRVP